MIDPNKRTHREKFQEYVEELLDAIPIENSLFELLENRLLKNLSWFDFKSSYLHQRNTKIHF